MLISALAAGLFVACSAHPATSDPAPLEASAKSGPVALTLRILNRVKTPREILYFEIELKNVGSEPIDIGDRAYINPNVLDQQSMFEGSGTYLQVRTPAGEKPYRAPPERWHKSTKPIPASQPRPAEPDGFTLEPGERRTVACARRKNSLDREWCPLDFWMLRDPGKHRIRAVYDARPSRTFPKDLSSPEQVRVATPWLSFEVRP